MTFTCPRCNIAGESEAGMVTCPTCHLCLGLVLDMTATSPSRDCYAVSLGALQERLHRGRLWPLGNMLSELRFVLYRVGKRL